MSYDISTSTAVLIGVLAVWELIWKGIALWRAARDGQNAWYIVMLVVNTAGILPILYILTHQTKSSSQAQKNKL